MASNISATISVGSSASGGCNRSATYTLAQTGDDDVDNTQNIATGSWQAISFGAVSGTPGAIAIVNLDTTHFVEIALDNAGANKIAKLLGGSPNGGILFLASPSTGTLYAQANTSACKLRVTAFDA